MALDEGNIVESAAGNGNKIQRFGPGHRYFDFCRSQGARIVQPLEVDLDQAGAELARGAELLGEPESDGAWTWLTFRAPNGNIHGLGARMAQRQARRFCSNARDMRHDRMVRCSMPRPRRAERRSAPSALPGPSS
jgi:hypothetical protein